MAEWVKSCSHCCQRPHWIQWEEGKTQERSQSLQGMEKAWGMIKCLGFDKTGAWYFFFWEQWGITKQFNAEENADFLWKSPNVCFSSDSSTHGLGSSSGQPPTQVCQGSSGWQWWLSFSCSLLCITKTHTDTHGLLPQATNGPSPGAGSPPRTSETSTRFRTCAYTVLSCSHGAFHACTQNVTLDPVWQMVPETATEQTHRPTNQMRTNKRAEFWLKERGGMWMDNTPVGIESNRHCCPKGAELVAEGLRIIMEQCNSWVEEGKLIVMNFYKRCSI